MPSKFYVDKTISVCHPDGWKHVISIYDDPPCIKIEYCEQQLIDNKAVYVTIGSVDGIWADSARLIAKALVELADSMEENNESH